MQVALLFCLLSVSPVEYTNNVDAIEINHFYDDKGRLVLDQVIVRELGRVRHYFVLKDCRPITISDDDRRVWEGREGVPYVPEFKPVNYIISKEGKGYAMMIQQQPLSIGLGPPETELPIYRIWAWSIYHTHTQYDPETEDRNIFMKESRAALIPYESR